MKSIVTDSESAKLESGSGFIQRYSAMTLVDAKHQIIVHAESIGQINEAPVPPNDRNTRDVGKAPAWGLEASDKGRVPKTNEVLYMVGIPADTDNMWHIHVSCARPKQPS